MPLDVIATSHRIEESAMALKQMHMRSTYLSGHRVKWEQQLSFHAINLPVSAPILHSLLSKLESSSSEGTRPINEGGTSGCVSKANPRLWHVRICGEVDLPSFWELSH